MSKSGAYNLPSLRSSLKKAAAAGSKKVAESKSTGQAKRKRNSSASDVSYRKRRLEDEIILIEQSASPGLRMNPSSPCPTTPSDPSEPPSPLTFDKFSAFMGKNVLPQFEDVRKRIESVSSQVHTNSADIARLKTQFEAIRSGPSHIGHDPDTRRYDMARRSIRIWPVAGSTEEELWSNTGVFIHNVLKVPADEMRDERITDIRRLRSPGASRIKDEVLVVFCDLENRDLVTSYARNLANHVDKDGSPSAGLRMDIPVQLMGTFRLLENHGKALRDRYGPEFRRHIRYDDQNRSLFLNIRIPGESSWTRISPALAQSFAEEKERSASTRDRLGLVATNRSTFSPPALMRGPPQQVQIQGTTYRRPRSIPEHSS